VQQQEQEQEQEQEQQQEQEQASMGKGKISGRGGASWLRWWLASEEGHPKHSGW